MPLRRTLKNVVKNYSDAQVKVREATSNDPWGPSSTLMTEIADLTYNVLAFTEIMQMVWKRLNDHGRNWRHVYKSLVLLEYIVKTGSEKVAHQCRENIFAIQTLKDFQYIEDAKDHGLNVREKAKQLVALLKDTERLKNERAKALKAKERFAQTTSGTPYPSASPVLPGVVTFPDSVVGKYSGFGSPSSWSLEGGVLDAELEAARPTSTGEEELQLELALAMSKEEHEQQMKLLKGDEVKLQMALEQSKMEQAVAQMKQNGKESPLADGAVGTSDPWLEWQYKPAKNSWFEDGRWSESKNSFQTWTEDAAMSTCSAAMLDHNTEEASKLSWTSTCFTTANAFEPADTQIHINDEFDKLSHRDQSEPGAAGDQTTSATRQLQVVDDPWRMENLELTVREIPITTTTTTTTSSATLHRQVRGKSPKDFLGENANLVNLDDLMSPIKTTGASSVSSAQSRGSSPALLTSNPFVTPDMHLPQSFNLPGASVPAFTLPHYPYQQLQNQATPSLPENPSNTMPKSTYPSEFNPFL